MCLCVCMHHHVYEWQQWLHLSAQQQHQEEQDSHQPTGGSGKRDDKERVARASSASNIERRAFERKRRMGSAEFSCRHTHFVATYFHFACSRVFRTSFSLSWCTTISLCPVCECACSRIDEGKEGERERIKGLFCCINCSLLSPNAILSLTQTHVHKETWDQGLRERKVDEYELHARSEPFISLCRLREDPLLFFCMQRQSRLCSRSASSSSLYAWKDWSSWQVDCEDREEKRE